MKILENILLKQ